MRRSTPPSGSPAKKGTASRSKAAVSLDELLALPPANPEELRRRIARGDPDVLRADVLERIESGELDEEDGSLAFAILGQVGLGEATARIEAFVLDASRPRALRSRAAMALSAGNPGAMGRLLSRLPPEEATLPVESAVYDLVSLAANDEGAARELATFLVDMPPAMRRALTAIVSRLRGEAGIPGSVIYGALLERPELHQIRASLLEELVEEGGQDATQLLMGLRDRAPGDRARREFSSALLRLRTRAIDPDRPQPSVEGEAWVSMCDGEGAFTLFGAIGDGRRVNLASLCIRVHGEIRDGFIRARVPRQETEFMRAEMLRAGCVSTRVSLDQAAALATAARERTEEMGRSLPLESRTALAMLDRDGAAPLAEVTPADEAPLATLREVLARPEFETWFFDASDLRPLQAPRRPTAAWVRKAAAHLRAQGLDARVRAMARFGAWWSVVAGNHEVGALLAAAARDLEADFDTAPLLRAMLEKSTRAAGRAEEPESVLFLGNPVLRRSLKHEFFTGLEQPRGKDLARLDFTEVALLELENAFETIPSEQRPADAQLRRAAHSFADAFWKMITGRGKKPPVLSVRELFGDVPLPVEERTRVTSLVLSGLKGFSDEICGACRVGCLEHPRTRVAEAFDNPGHPGFQR